MKRLVAAALAGIMAISMVGCGAAPVSSNKEKFVVGFDASFPPYGYIDEETDEYVGFDLDLAAEVCKRNGWELVKTPIDWDAKDFELNSRYIADCLPQNL